ncbi:DUF1667 domain-containing protein [Helicovermis profundi]|uniref:DUF1667 domain-containing protein n=1 Tax=Helicovermis profundi TaxID=3065157 RepID=A0AAU9EB56_9FIRM|nr:DUF1667 domain-containing protein [Clostridia bacterium S502]
MDKTKEIICIVCPVGCRLKIIKNIDTSTYSVKGNKCNRGKIYGIKELTNPTRKVPSTVAIENALYTRLPVITDKAIDKKLIFDVMDELKKVSVKAPINMGDIIIHNILDTNVNIIATRSMAALKK